MGFRSESHAMQTRFAGLDRQTSFGRPRLRLAVMHDELADHEGIPRIIVTRNIFDIATAFTHISCRKIGRFMSDKEFTKITETIDVMESRGVLVRPIRLVRKRNVKYGMKTRKIKPPCFICSTRKALTWHHIIPRALGGANTNHNLLSLCRKCHDSVESRIFNMEREAVETRKTTIHIDYIGVIVMEKLRSHGILEEASLVL